MSAGVGLDTAARWAYPPDAAAVAAIANLVQVYALLCDQGCTAEMDALFTVDAQWDGSDLGYGEAAGADAIARHVTAHHRPSEPMMHMPGPPVLVRGDGPDVVHGVAWSLAIRWTGGVPGPLICFTYEDVFRRDADGVWRFAQRVLRRRSGGAPPVEAS